MSKKNTLYSESKNYNKVLCDKDVKKTELTNDVEKLKQVADKYLSDSNIEKYYDVLMKIKNVNDEIAYINKYYDKTQYYVKNAQILEKYHNDLTKVNSNINRQELLNQYMINTNPNYAIDNKIDNSDDYCYKCKRYKDFLYNESLLICAECGNETLSHNFDEHVTYGEPQQETTYFKYQPLNHFKDHLLRLQAKEPTIIPQIIYDIILVEFDKEKKTNLSELNATMVKKYLRKYTDNSEIKISKYYENAHKIIYNLTGIEPLHIPKEIEMQLCNMFVLYEEQFRKICGDERHSLLTYEYILYKFCELLEYTSYQKFFNLLKSDDKLSEQDKYWKQICHALNWKYYPTCRNSL
jgi:hypothetical protein